MSSKDRWMAFWWVLGGMLVLVGAIVLRDKSTRHKVIRAMARRWDKNVVRPSKSRKKAKARAHLQERKATAKSLPQASRPFERPRKPILRPTRCSAACRTSRKPAFDRKTGRLLCDCPCGGREHGMYRKGATAAPKLPKQAVGTSGAKKPAAKVSAPKPAAPARPAAATATKPRPSSPPVRPISKTAAPEKPTTWRGLQVGSWEQMKSHAEQSKRCASGTFSTRTYRDRRTDPPKVTQTVVCDTCSKEL